MPMPSSRVIEMPFGDADMEVLVLGSVGPEGVLALGSAGPEVYVGP